MGAATLPTISFETEGKEVNMLVGHKKEMNMASMRDTILVYGKSGKIQVHVQENESQAKSLTYEIYTPDGTEKLFGDTEKKVDETVTLAIKDVLKKDKEGILRIALQCEEGIFYYYTRVVQNNNYHVKECLDYVEELHNNLIQKENEDAVKKVMESNAQGDNTTLGHVTIHSNLKHVMWGDLNPKVVGEPSFEIKETKKAYTSVQLHYRVKCAGDNNKEELYNVKEFFKISYGKERMYLLEYDRTMEEVFTTSNVVLSGKGIILGIAQDDLLHRVNQKGTMVSFIQANELWSYNKEENSFSLVFSFADSEKEDVRNYTDNHSVRILSMSEEGNMTFSVCGYMNRGTHEGESGVAVYYYNATHNTVEEVAFIPSEESLSVIEKELNELAYYNKDQKVLYVLAGGTLLKVKSGKKGQEVLIEGLQKGQYVVSSDGHLLAYQKGKDKGAITEIWDFANDKQWTVSAEKGEQVIPLGFIGNDIVYGLFYAENRGYDSAGVAVTPMHRLEIRNERQKVVKTYQKDKAYILGATVENNLITIRQGVKNGNLYTDIEENYITSNEATGSEYVLLQSYWTDLKETQYRLAFSEGLQNKKAKTLKPKQVVREKQANLDLEQDKKEEYFYAYGHGEQIGVFEEANDAIAAASKVAGVVLSPKQNYVWEDGNRVAWYRNFNIDRFVAQEGETTLAACLRRVLAYQGQKVDVKSELNGKNPEEILAKHLDAEVVRFRGCSVKDMFYLIDKGIPIVALKDSTNAILLVGYDAKTVTYVDPATGSIFTSAIEKVNEMVAGSAHSFISYVK